jgi:hypothetical protein
LQRRLAAEPEGALQRGDPLVELDHLADRFAEQRAAGEQPRQCEKAGLDLFKGGGRLLARGARGCRKAGKGVADRLDTRDRIVVGRAMIAQCRGEADYLGFRLAELPRNLLELAAQRAAGVAARADIRGELAGFGAERL